MRAHLAWCQRAEDRRCLFHLRLLFFIVIVFVHWLRQLVRELDDGSCVRVCDVCVESCIGDTNVTNGVELDFLPGGEGKTPVMCR